MPEQPDLFGETQPDLFAGMETPQPVSYAPDPAVVRRRLVAVLEQARSAESMPWDGKRTQFWQTVFPQMANWLPEEEAAQLRFEFARELERLMAA
jgi:hypothetical protein